MLINELQCIESDNIHHEVVVLSIEPHNCISYIVQIWITLTLHRSQVPLYMLKLFLHPCIEIQPENNERQKYLCQYLYSLP